MQIPTPATLRSRNRRFDRRLNRAELVMQAMKNGAALHLEHTVQGPHWSLSNGREVADAAAKLVVASGSIIDCGDALFADVAAQTFRWWREP